MMSAADVNGDGVIEYDEFIPVGMEVLKAQNKQSSMSNIVDLPTTRIIMYMRELFTKGDENGDGVLSPTEFANLMKRSGFKFPPELILKLVKDADLNGDGMIQFEEFMPIMLEMLQVYSTTGDFDDSRDEEQTGNMPTWDQVPEATMGKYLERLFAVGDTNGDGVLEPQEFLELLTRCGLRFPAELVLDMFLMADTNGDGVIEYSEFIPAMKSIIAGAKEAGWAKESQVATSYAPDKEVQDVSTGGHGDEISASPMPDVRDIPPALLDRYLKDLFSIADGNEEGVCTPAQVSELLCLSGFNFPMSQITELMSQADVNEDDPNPNPNPKP